MPPTESTSSQVSNPAAEHCLTILSRVLYVVTLRVMVETLCTVIPLVQSEGRALVSKQHVSLDSYTVMLTFARSTTGNSTTVNSPRPRRKLQCSDVRAQVGRVPRGARET